MSEKKPYKKDEQNKSRIDEPETAYSIESRSKTITISTLEELEELNRVHTRNLSPPKRMEYLRKLNENIFGFDLSRQQAVLRKGNIIIRRKS